VAVGIVQRRAVLENALTVHRSSQSPAFTIRLIGVAGLNLQMNPEEHLSPQQEA
jgi:hypothetical protein